MSRARVSAAAGAAVMTLLWLIDLIGFADSQFAGVSDSEAQRRLAELTTEAVRGLELQLLALHVVSGAGFGALLGIALGAVPRLRLAGWRLGVVAAGTTVTLALLGLASLAGRYPQLLADRWWVEGGVLAELQLAITHGPGPVPFEIAEGMIYGLVALLVAVRGWQALAPRLRRAPRVAAVSAAVLAGVALLATTRTPQPAVETPNVLILAADSLRSDRIDAPAVMPFLSARSREGALFRFAFTPIARTYPSWISTLTGRETAGHGVRHMFPTRAARGDLGPTLISVLRDRGYHTFVTSDFAGDIFPGFEAGFESVDTPHLTVDALARATALAAHTWTLPLLRFAPFRELLSEWRNLPSLADPDWVVERVTRQLDAAASERRPFAGVVFFSTAHFPYVAPYPHYLRGSGEYRGRYLYHAPPVTDHDSLDRRDVAQIRARYDAALTAIDAAIARLFEQLESRDLTRSTLIAVIGDHGEDLYEEGLAGHGDTVASARAQAVPILLSGPGVERGLLVSEQARLYDLPATILDLLDPEGATGGFGDGRSLLQAGLPRPICVETGLWFWPDRPVALRGERLTYEPFSQLLEVDPSSREMVLRQDREELVETAKERGLILGSQLWRERFTPTGREAGLLRLSQVPETPAEGESVDLAALFEERCVARDPRLRRLLGGVVFLREPEPPGGAP